VSLFLELWLDRGCWWKWTQEYLLLTRPWKCCVCRGLRWLGIYVSISFSNA